MAVDLALAKQHLRVTSDSEDTIIAQYLAAAKAWVETFTGTKLTRASVTQGEYRFVDFRLLYGPDVDDLSIAYVDSDGNAQTITDALIVGDRVYAPETGWPAITENTPITLAYTAGFATVPAELDSAVLLLVGEAFDNREAGTMSSAAAMAVESLCRPYRRLGL